MTYTFLYIMQTLSIVQVWKCHFRPVVCLWGLARVVRNYMFRNKPYSYCCHPVLVLWHLHLLSGINKSYFIIQWSCYILLRARLTFDGQLGSVGLDLGFPGNGVVWATLVHALVLRGHGEDLQVSWREHQIFTWREERGQPRTTWSHSGSLTMSFCITLFINNIIK